MKGRCSSPSHAAFADYGGRGIGYDPRWEQFENFLADMGEAPAGLSLDRINNDLGYSKGNCRWATWKQQNRNNRGNHIVEHDGKKLCVTEWAEQGGLNPYILFGRLQRGWPFGRALSQPVQER